MKLSIVSLTAMGVLALVASGLAQDTTKPTFDEMLRMVEQQVQAGKWEEAAMSADKLSKAAADPKDGKVCDACTRYSGDLKSAITARDKEKAQKAINDCRTHWTNVHKGAKKEGPKESEPYPR